MFASYWVVACIGMCALLAIYLFFTAQPALSSLTLRNILKHALSEYPEGH